MFFYDSFASLTLTIYDDDLTAFYKKENFGNSDVITNVSRIGELGVVQ